MRSPVLILVAATAIAAAAPQDVPYSDLLSFARERVADKANDAKTRFSLGRVLLVGYAKEPEVLDVSLNAGTGLVDFQSADSVQVVRMDGPLSADAKSYLKEACLNLNRATRYDANNALFSLANAWAFEQLASHWDEVMGSESFGEFGNQKDAWAKVAAEYRRAWNSAKDKDLGKKVSDGASKDSLVSREAAKNMLRLRQEGHVRVTDAEAARFQKTIDDLGG
jgi:hypothetical protein